MGKTRIWMIIKTALAVLILAAVGWHFVRIIQHHQFDATPLKSRWGWLVPAGIAYLGAHFIWGTFWWMLLCGQKVQVGWAVALRSYFVSQFGKYIPGKIWVILMRVAMLRGVPGASTATVVVTATYETLTSMAAGALLAAVFFPSTGVLEGHTIQYLQWFFALAGLPLGLGMVNRLGARTLHRMRGPNVRPMPAPSIGLLFLGLLQATLGWCLLSVSLRCVILAVSDDIRDEWSTFTADLATVGASYVAGFVMLVSPGGLGPREFVLQELLSRRVGGPGTAVIVALVLRLIWTLFEVVLAGIWYLIRNRPPLGSVGDKPLAESAS